jgi:hypothetical protein
MKKEALLRAPDPYAKKIVQQTEILHGESRAQVMENLPQQGVR